MASQQRLSHHITSHHL